MEARERFRLAWREARICKRENRVYLGDFRVWLCLHAPEHDLEAAARWRRQARYAPMRVFALVTFGKRLAWAAEARRERGALPA